METTQVDPGLAEFIRSHRVHYEVIPDAVVQTHSRLNVGYEVRLLALHERNARALPGCEKCRDLVAGLKGLAVYILPREERPTRAEIEPFDPVLYDSKELAGVDEVAVSIRLSHRDGHERAIDSCQERCLKEIRQRLKRLGVPER